MRGTLSYDYKVTYQKEDVTVGNMNGTVDGSSQMSAEFVYKDGNYQLRTVNPEVSGTGNRNKWFGSYG